MVGLLALTLLLLRPQEISARLIQKSVSTSLSSQAAPAPEFAGSKADWIQKPVTLKSLKGKVVLVDFWAYTCVNCIRTFPYLNEWYRRYHDKGFEIVAIHRPEFDFEGVPANVKSATKRFGFAFSVLNDPNGKNWDNYHVEAWPTKFLIDGTGNVVAGDVGEGNYDVMEKAIQNALAKAKPGVKLPPIMKPVRDTDAPGAVCRPCTLEIYAGFSGLQNVVKKAATLDTPTKFALPEKRYSGVFFNGTWTPRKGFIESGQGGAALLKYMAKDVDSVLRTTGGPVMVQLYQDGKPVPKEDIGDDVKMVNGIPTMKVVEPKMYSVLKNRQWGMHEVELRPQSAGLRLYSFTFGSECRPLPKRK
jgi:thiol-disulfide isomerase/thioredoxin